jgi:hypothetical protein
MAALTTELDAVNVILGGVGQAPVTTLSGTLTGDTSRALATLRQVTSELQVKGWSFNTDLDFTLKRDVSNNIPLPAATVSLTINWASCSYDIDPVIRNGFLYDRKNQTDKFTVDVPVKRLTYLLDWDDTPEPFRVYAKYVARRFRDSTFRAATSPRSGSPVR